MAALSEETIMQCCSCRSFAQQLARVLGPGVALDVVIDNARRIWWQDVSSRLPHALMWRQPPVLFHCTLKLTLGTCRNFGVRPYCTFRGFAQNILCCYAQTSVSGWLEAFAAHTRIGDVAGLKQKFGAFADMSRTEQSAAAASAADGVFEVRTCICG